MWSQFLGCYKNDASSSLFQAGRVWQCKSGCCYNCGCHNWLKKNSSRFQAGRAWQCKSRDREFSFAEFPTRPSICLHFLCVILVILVMVMYVVDDGNLARWSLPSKQVGRVGEDTQLRQTSRPSQRESERTFYRQSKWKGKTKTNIVKGQRQGKEGLKRYFIEKDKEKTKKRTKTRKTSRPLQRESEKVYTDQVKAKN